MAVAAIVGRRPERAAARWLIGTVAWSMLALAVFAPSLAVVTPGLPNDHYHAFLDPLVLALAAAGIARIWTGLRTGSGADAGQPCGTPARSAGRPAVAGLLPRAAAVAHGLLVGISVTAWPPAVSPDGGWRAAERAALQIQSFAPGRPYALVGIPAFKSRRLRPVPALAPGRGSARAGGHRRHGSPADRGDRVRPAVRRRRRRGVRWSRRRTPGSQGRALDLPLLGRTLRGGTAPGHVLLRDALTPLTLTRRAQAPDMRTPAPAGRRSLSPRP